MNKLIKGYIGVALFFLSGPWAIADTADQSISEYQHTGKQYPPVFFVTNIDDEAFTEKLKAYNAFTRLDSDAVGLPIGVRVLKGHRNKQDAASFSTTMLSASTLGLIPIVSNTEFKVHYDVFVQGKSIAKFKYQMDTTDVENIWLANKDGRETTPSEQLFVEYTLPRFLNELKNSSEARAVFREYWEYFAEN